MKGLKDTLADLAGFRKRFDKLVSTAKSGSVSPPLHPDRLSEITGFGSNPGNLRMLAHVPRDSGRAPLALVVALHGCTQTALAYDHGSGWSDLADAFRFAVLLPEQQRANNPNNCFNWFQAADTQRGHGEAQSIRQMIDRMIADHGIDRKRVFIVGLSAGGAMAAAMLASYPEAFAGGAIVAGLPSGAAANVHTAFEAMAGGGRDRTAREWGDLVRSASSHSGPWPRISIWHGTADAIVSPANMERLLDQWTSVHGVDATPDLEDTLHGHSRRVWQNAGNDVIEAISIKGMGHGVPLAASHGEQSFGNVSPFHFDVGISSSRHILEFWDLADADSASVQPVQARAAGQAPVREAQLLAARASLPSDNITAGHGNPDRIAAAGWAGAATLRDTSTVITAALEAAGLVKSKVPGTRANATPLDPHGIIASTLRSVGLLKE